MIIDVATYIDGHRHECEDFASALAERRRDARGFLWIELKEPTTKEISQVASDLGLHQLAVEDAVAGHQRPKLDLYEFATFLVVKTMQYVENTSDIETGEVMIFLGDRFVVVVRRGSGSPMIKVRRELEADPEVLARGASVVLYKIVDSIVDTYIDIELELQRDLDRIEAEVFSGSRRSEPMIMYALKREVLEFRRSALPLVEPLRRLAHRSVPYVDPDAQLFFADAFDHLLQVTERVESQDHLLSEILNAHLAQVSVQQNTDMRKISAWVAIAAFPTLVAGIYGMNFDSIPELHWSFGYGYFWVLIVVVSIFLYRAFKRADWL